MTETNLREIFDAFAIEGEFTGSQYLKVGHINDTFLIEARTRQRDTHFIFQRINHLVFPDPERLMANFQKITQHLRAKLEKMPGRDPDRETLNLVPSRSGRSYHRTPQGEYWRAYRFVGNAHIINVATRPEQASEAGRAFGGFQRLLADLPASTLHETIPFFHHTPRRLARFKEVLATDPHRRAAQAEDAIAFVLERTGMVGVVTDGLDAGRLPLRVTHNDTKINNVLFDNETGKAICVIDLDTTMPGSILYDFGDMVRTTTCRTEEDEPDISKVKMEMDLFSALVEGYLQEAGEFLTEEEIGLLAFSGRLITFTIGLRFLTDFLAGDVYFRTNRSGQNLDRARVQFALIQSMEKQAQEMEDCIRFLCQR
ncbi:MAG: phosphotransferase enzyme family protein [Candidatus Aminicenantales bacterium]